MKIESYFSGIKAANEAVEALKKAGINNAVADLNDHYTGILTREQIYRVLPAVQIAYLVMYFQVMSHLVILCLDH